MAEVSLTAYATRHGVSRQAAAKWRTRGYLVCRGEMVDVDASDAKMKACGKGRFNRGAASLRRRGGQSADVRSTTLPAPDTLTRRAAPIKSPTELHASIDPGEDVCTRPWSDRADRLVDGGLLSGMVYLGRQIPRMAHQAALRCKGSSSLATAIDQELRVLVSRAVDLELEKSGVSKARIEAWSGGMLLFEDDDFSTPLERDGTGSAATRAP